MKVALLCLSLACFVYDLSCHMNAKSDGAAFTILTKASVDAKKSSKIPE